MTPEHAKTILELIDIANEHGYIPRGWEALIEEIAKLDKSLLEPYLGAPYIVNVLNKGRK